MDDDAVNEVSEIGNKGKPLLLDENDVQTKIKHLTSKVDHPSWSSKSLFDSYISDHPPWSSKSMNEKRNKRWSDEFLLFKNYFTFVLDLSLDPIDMTNEVKYEHEMEDPLEDPYEWKQDPYHGDDEAEENAESFAKLDYILERLPFLNDELQETVVGVDASVVADDALVELVDAPVIALEEQLEMIENVFNEEIERPRKRKRENEGESASGNVPFGKIKQEEKVESS
ncbi:hypothetical protein Tco_1073098 [Tanacetum coccineum]